MDWYKRKLRHQGKTVQARQAAIPEAAAKPELISPQPEHIEWLEFHRHKWITLRDMLGFGEGDVSVEMLNKAYASWRRMPKVLKTREYNDFVTKVLGTAYGDLVCRHGFEWMVADRNTFCVRHKKHDLVAFPLNSVYKRIVDNKSLDFDKLLTGVLGTIDELDRAEAAENN